VNPGVPEWNELLLEEAIGLGQRRDILDAQLLEQSVLQRAEEPFDAPFGLRRVGRDHLAVQSL
jgi:hypothetical protein